VHASMRSITELQPRPQTAFDGCLYLIPGSSRFSLHSGISSSLGLFSFTHSLINDYEAPTEYRAMH
jgi:hypothetical protein